MQVEKDVVVGGSGDALQEYLQDEKCFSGGLISELKISVGDKEICGSIFGKLDSVWYTSTWR